MPQAPSRVYPHDLFLEGGEWAGQGSFRPAGPPPGSETPGPSWASVSSSVVSLQQAIGLNKITCVYERALYTAKYGTDISLCPPRTGLITWPPQPHSCLLSSHGPSSLQLLSACTMYSQASGPLHWLFCLGWPFPPHLPNSYTSFETQCQQQLPWEAFLPETPPPGRSGISVTGLKQTSVLHAVVE